MKLNFDGAVAYTLRKEPMLIKLHEIMGEVIYSQSNSIMFKRVAEDIFDGKTVDVSEEDLGLFERMINSETCTYVIPIKVALLDRIEQVKSGQYDASFGGEEIID